LLTCFFAQDNQDCRISTINRSDSAMATSQGQAALPLALKALGHTLITLIHGLNDTVCALVLKMALHDQQRMDHTGNPKQQRQENIEYALERLTAQKNRQRR
jgi:predicted esterase